MVNSLSCGCQCVLQPFTVRRNRHRGRDAIEYVHGACLPNSTRHNERFPTSQQGVNRLHFPVRAEPLRSSCSPTTSTLAVWPRLHSMSSSIGVPVARTHAPQAKFRQVPAPITRVQPLLSGRCTCSVTWIFKTPRSRGETDIKDVFVTFARSRN